MVARRQEFLAGEFSKRFEKSYPGLTATQQKGVDKAIIALLKRKPIPGMRIKKSGLTTTTTKRESTTATG